MSDQWDRFRKAAPRQLDALGWRDNVRVFEPSESWTPGEGASISYPDEPTAIIPGSVEPPGASSDIDRGGTTQDADLVVHVLASSDVSWTGAGESGEANTRITVERDSSTYEVDTIEPQYDGFVTLNCSEVN